MTRFFAVFLLAGGLLWSMASNSATVYSESFAGINNLTPLNGIQPIVGQAWSVAGGQRVQGNAIPVTASNIEAYGPFTSALASGTLTFSLNFSAFTCSGSSSNMGVNLFAGAAEIMFVGCSTGNVGSLRFGLNGATANTVVGNGTTGTVTITYNYSTGAYTVQAPGGSQVNGNTTANLAIDRLRVSSDGNTPGGTSITVTNFLVDFVTPVPTLSEWMQLLLALMVLSMIGWHFHRERSY